MKGLILAGGEGTRLKPLTDVCSKQLLPVYDRPMIHYPVWTLLSLDCTDLGIIVAEGQTEPFRRALGEDIDAIKPTYIEQAVPSGLAEAPLLAREWLDGQPFWMMLGDNLLVTDLADVRARQVATANREGMIFTVLVSNPERYGCWEDDRMIEKPARSQSGQAVIGLYWFPGDVPKFCETLKPSARGQLEIADVINWLNDAGRLRVGPLLDDYTCWFDLGDYDSLLEGSEYIRAMRKRHGSRIGKIE